MNSKIFILILLLVGIAAFVGFFMQMKKTKIHSVKMKKNAEKGKRRTSDIRELSSKDRKVYQQAKILTKQKRFTQAAQLLESIQMQREAINILEKAGLIHEAARILMRMGRHNRAGVVYARNKYWERAAESFKYANMPLEAAKCALEFGNLELAAENFEAAEHYKEAGDIYTKLGQVQKASKLYVKIGDTHQAVQQFALMIKGSKTPIKFDVVEIKLMCDWVKAGNFDVGIGPIVAQTPKIVEILLELLAKKFSDVAFNLYKLCEKDVGSQLLSNVDYENPVMWDEMIRMFILSEQFSNAGVLYENKNMFKEAGEAFERGGEIVRSAHCFDRAGLNKKALELREKYFKDKKSGNGAHIPPSPNNMFSMRMSAVEDDQEKFDTGEETDPVIVEEVKVPKVVKVSFAEKLKTMVEKKNSETFGVELTLGFAKIEQHAKPAIPFLESKIELIDAFAGIDQEDEVDVELKAVEESTQHHLAVTSNEPLPVLGKLPSELKVEFFRSTLLTALDDDEKEKFWSIGYTKHYKSGDLILNYHDEPKGVYVILSGQVACFRRTSKGKDMPLDMMESSKSFGELWLLADHPTEVKFLAVNDVILQIVSREAFSNLIDHEGVIARKVYRKFTSRLVKRLLSPFKSPKGKPHQHAS